MTATTQTNLLTATRHTPHSHQGHFITKNNSSQPWYFFSQLQVPCRNTFSQVPGPLPHSHQEHFLTGPATAKENTSSQQPGTPFSLPPATPPHSYPRLTTSHPQGTYCNIHQARLFFIATMQPHLLTNTRYSYISS